MDGIVKFVGKIFFFKIYISKGNHFSDYFLTNLYNTAVRQTIISMCSDTYSERVKMQTAVFSLIPYDIQLQDPVLNIVQ